MTFSFPKDVLILPCAINEEDRSLRGGCNGPKMNRRGHRNPVTDAMTPKSAASEDASLNVFCLNAISEMTISCQRN